MTDDPMSGAGEAGPHGAMPPASPRCAGHPLDAPISELEDCAVCGPVLEARRNGSLLTLIEANRELRRRECATHGHSWRVIDALGGPPANVICERCGTGHAVVKAGMPGVAQMCRHYLRHCHEMARTERAVLEVDLLKLLDEVLS